MSILSRINAILAIYPESSSIENNMNNVKICGKKPIIANNPPKTPSQINPPTHSGDEDNNPATNALILSVIKHTILVSIIPGENTAPSYTHANS